MIKKAEFEQPVISIIVPTLNSGGSLSECLNSIVNQHYKKFEIILIDGLSTDNTLDIIRAFATKYNSITFVSEKDHGIYDAMNKGINLASGKWIYFIGSDDKLINSDVLQRIYDELSDKNVDVIYGNVLSTRFNGSYDGEFNNLKILSQNICHQAIFFKKTVFRKTGLFDLRYKSHADWAHNLKWFLNIKIRKKYVNLDIAEYGDGGYSSIHPDEIFSAEKNLKIIKYGLFSLPIEIINNLSKDEYRKALISKEFTKTFLLKVINLYAKLMLKFR